MHRRISVSFTGANYRNDARPFVTLQQTLKQSNSHTVLSCLGCRCEQFLSQLAWYCGFFLRVVLSAQRLESAYFAWNIYIYIKKARILFICSFQALSRCTVLVCRHIMNRLAQGKKGTRHQMIFFRNWTE